jgi:hypothetical protein
VQNFDCSAGSYCTLPDSLEKNRILMSIPDSSHKSPCADDHLPRLATWPSNQRRIAAFKRNVFANSVQYQR